MENRNIHYCIVLSQQQEEFLDSAKSGVNRYRFIHFLARNAAVEQTACKVKGYTVSLQVGQVAFAEGELARLFGCERKTIQRLVESMRALQLVSTNSTNHATVFTLLYLSGWLIEGNMVRNPYYHRPLAKTRQENVVSVPSGMNVTLPNNSTSSLCSEEIDTMDNVGKSEWKSNSHAHILFDWMDHATGKSWKLDKKAMSDLQTLAAETLNMELSSRNSRMKSRHQTDLEWRDRLLRIFAEMFYQVKEFFRKAVDAIISLATPDRQGRHREIFRNEEAAAIKETMNEFADTESGRISIGKWLVDYASSKAALSDLDVYHAQGEVDGVAQGRYDWRIERGELNMSL